MKVVLTIIGVALGSLIITSLVGILIVFIHIAKFLKLTKLIGGKRDPFNDSNRQALDAGRIDEEAQNIGS
ncbi:MAG: hypothetical protein JRJ47_00565 [Deltaproteobacteria bacterium]|nr:hypothetical protein [Deltaproteobacteria bacterium]